MSRHTGFSPLYRQVQRALRSARYPLRHYTEELTALERDSWSRRYARALVTISAGDLLVFPIASGDSEARHGLFAIQALAGEGNLTRHWYWWDVREGLLEIPGEEGWRRWDRSSLLRVSVAHALERVYVQAPVR